MQAGKRDMSVTTHGEPSTGHPQEAEQRHLPHGNQLSLGVSTEGLVGHGTSYWAYSPVGTSCFKTGHRGHQQPVTGTLSLWLPRGHPWLAAGPFLEVEGGGNGILFLALNPQVTQVPAAHAPVVPVSQGQEELQQRPCCPGHSAGAHTAPRERDPVTLCERGARLAQAAGKATRHAGAGG